MTVKLAVWTKAQAKEELTKRLSAARKAKAYLEQQWAQNERAVFSTSANPYFYGEQGLPWTEESDEAGRQHTLTTSYVLKNVRFLHSQMSSNPPVTTARPNSADPEDRRSADAADRILRYGLRKYKKQNHQDLVNLNVLVYGTGFGKTVFNPNAGMPTAFDPAEGAIEFEGDFENTEPHPRKMFIDPDANNPLDLQWVIEAVDVPLEKACLMFPSHEETLKGLVPQDWQLQQNVNVYDPFIKFKRFSRIPLYQYWETGTPENGMKGRFCWHLEDGTVLSDGTEVGPSPYSFKVFSPEGSELGSYAKLPYHVLTDIDVPGSPWGQTPVSYAAPIQDLLNHIDNASADILQAHGVARILAPENAELNEEALTNNNWDIIIYSGQVAPHYMEPLPFPQALVQQREQLRKSIDDIFGLTDLNFGQQQRETANSAMQFAVEQSNLIRKRLFNKLIAFVESEAQDFLSLVANNWNVPRTIKVIGREKAFEVMDIKGSDIRSGYDVHTEYGTSLSLDPMARRMELMQYMPLFEKANIKMRTVLGLMRMSELDTAWDLTQLAADRQREYFEEIIASGTYIPPGEEEDNINMLEYAMNWRMTSEFKYLDDATKQLCLQHIKARKDKAAAEVVPTPDAAQALPMALPPGPQKA
jgi:hypothetical protein